MSISLFTDLARNEPFVLPGVPVAVDETAREVSEGQLLPGGGLREI